MTRIVVTGYASLDYVVRLDGVPEANRTTRIIERTAWPRLGGGPGLRRRGAGRGRREEGDAVTWIGKDPAGETWLASLGEAGVSPEGVAINNEGRTPVSVLAYQPDGGCIASTTPGSTTGQH